MSRFVDLNMGDLNRREVYNLVTASEQRKLFNATGILAELEANGINYVMQSELHDDEYHLSRFDALASSHENLLFKERHLEFEVNDLKRRYEEFSAVVGLRLFLIFAGRKTRPATAK